ncbi:hypothetical protein V6N13_080769 [Hibiscus sabdariffa]
MQKVCITYGCNGLGARNRAMPFSIVANANIRNPFVDVFSVNKPAEDCVSSGIVDDCSECCHSCPIMLPTEPPRYVCMA